MRILSQRQRVKWALKHDLGQLLAERRVDLIENQRADEKFAASSAPMPTAWLPCPGNRNAIVIFFLFAARARRWPIRPL